MRSHTMVLISLAAALLFAMPADLQAQWMEDGTPVCTHGLGIGEPVMTTDGEGGAYIAWLDLRISPNGIFVQHISPHGDLLWAVDGIVVKAGPGSINSTPKIIPDGAGGAYIAWEDTRNGDYDIFMQRVDFEGNMLWTPNGVAVCIVSGDQRYLDLAQDTDGGALVVWDDDRTGAPGIYAQKIAADSTSQWTMGGALVKSTMASSADYPVVTGDGYGGAIVAWMDYTSLNWDIRAQALDEDGDIAWSLHPDGAIVCDDLDQQVYPIIVDNGAMGAIVVWRDYRNGNTDIYAQMLSSIGSIHWTYNGISICSATGTQQYPDMVKDDNGSVIITWEDHRGSYSDIYAQRISSYGTQFWGTDGMAVCTAEGYSTSPQVVLDGAGGVVIAWIDNRSWAYDVYAQRIDSGGGIHWDTDGARICSSLAMSKGCAAPDGAGGAIVSWYDSGTGVFNIYASRIEANGYWGYPSPMISGIADVPNDQGGLVSMEWASSRLDAFPDFDITHYSIWRSLSSFETAALEAEGKKIVDIEMAGELPVSSEARFIILGEGYAWEWLSDMTSLAQPLYSYTAATLWDSTGLGNEQSHFMVAAHTDVPSVYWISGPDSCYSVDNLAPGMPLGLAGEQFYTPEGLGLAWDPNGESDLFGYRIYRGSTDDFVPGPGNFVASTPDTFSFDGDWTWDSGFFYKVSAVDIHGNESPFALLLPAEVTGDDPMPLPDATFLAQNFPNPFNPITNIEFGIKEQGHVSLRIYDAAGRLVAELINESRQAGQYSAVWNGKDRNGSSAASGVYFYKLVAGEFVQTRKMVLLR